MAGRLGATRWIVSIAAVAAVVLSGGSAAVADAKGLDFPLPLPQFHQPRTVTTTLVNRTGCTLVGSRGRTPVYGYLAAAPPLQIAPGATGVRQSSGWWLGDPSTSVTLTYALTGCSYAGEVGYTTANIAPDGVYWGQYSCDTHPIRGLVSVMTGTNGMDATVRIDLKPALIIKLPPLVIKPMLGACGSFPTANNS